jgi:hypothetical protein
MDNKFSALGSCLHGVFRNKIEGVDTRERAQIRQGSNMDKGIIAATLFHEGIHIRHFMLVS